MPSVSLARPNRFKYSGYLSFEREEVQKINKAERDTRYRERKKKEQATLEKELGAPGGEA